MSEALQALIVEAESMERDQVTEQEKLQPGYQSPDDIRAACHDRAVWIIGGFEAVMKMIKPAGAGAVLDDQAMLKGVDKVEAVLMKYPGGDVPEWVKRLMSYREEFECGVWVAGVVYGIHQAEKAIAAEQEHQAEQDQEEAGDAD